MTRRHWFAVGVALLAMLLALAPPLWVRSTGHEVTLPIRPVDPLAIFRGNYVDLVYDISLPIGPDERDRSVYAVFADGRPGRLVRISDDRPELADGEFCIRARTGYDTVALPHLEQFFVTPERGRELEMHLTELLAVIKVTDGCRAVLVDLEPRSAVG